MTVQSLSVVVPNKKCVNDCAFCVSKMHCDNYPNMMDANLPFYDLYYKDYIERLEFARDNGCNTLMLTGNSEPQQNRHFLQTFGIMNSNLQKPFRWIEMQTTGTLIDDPYLRFLRNHVGISTISLSVSALDDVQNKEYNGTRDDMWVCLEALCASIKKYDFNLRISVNLTDAFDACAACPGDLFIQLKEYFHANQVTFRVLYTSTYKLERMTEQDKWIVAHSAKQNTIDCIKAFIQKHGRPLEKLPFGATKYSLMGLSTVLDDDCMSKATKEELKYMVLQPNCKLYSKWDDPASLIF